MIGNDVFGLALIILAGLTFPLLIIYILYVPAGWVRYLPKIIVGLAFLGFLFVAIHVIVRASVVSIDGQRYFTLFDDAMISMRYAWNLTHGQGLVWNPGEHVEGYTNLLTTLLMALPMLVFDKSPSVLALQIMGICFALANAWLMATIALVITRQRDALHRHFIAALAFVCGLLYLPLSYWPVIGGDLGPQVFFMLLGVLAAFKYTAGGPPRWGYGLPIFLGLSYLTRPDALIAALLILLYVLLVERVSWPAVWMVGGFLLFPVGQLLFRMAYYGELLPNTYILKMVGMPLAERLRDGRTFIAPFIETTGWIIAFVSCSCVYRFQARRLLAVSIALALMGYQVWVGGDIFPRYWRFLAPLMPLILIYFLDEIIVLVKTLFGLVSPTPTDNLYLVVLAMTGFTLIVLNGYYFTVDSFLEGPLNIHFNTHQVDLAVALNQVTTSDALVGVTSAGITPYYIDRVALDFLGKTDAYIARMNPRLGTHGGDGMGNFPGHVKYNLYYSIGYRLPDYVERFAWGDQNLSDYLDGAYVDIWYAGVIRMFLKIDSPYVRWDLIDIDNSD